MKYGEALYERSVKQWAPYNIDYNELKELIRVNTSHDPGQAITIPGNDDSALHDFENVFFLELHNQHDRVNLFVKSKADEFRRRLLESRRKADILIPKCERDCGPLANYRRRERLSKLETRIMRCGEDIRNLDRFVQAQQIGFRKLLKKYKKWTGSQTLAQRVNDEVLGSPKSFARFDFEPLYSEYNTLITRLRDVTPSASGSSTPKTGSSRGSRRNSHNITIHNHTSPIFKTTLIEQESQGYWNEYDHGSDAEDNAANAPYHIYVNPDTPDSFPGSETLSHILHFLSTKTQKPRNALAQWLLLPSLRNPETRPLLTTREPYVPSHPNIEETDIDDEEASSDFDFPSGYATHYATFPSVPDQKLAAHREVLLFHSTIGCFAAALLLLVMSGVLLGTGRRKLRAEVDAGVIAGVIAGLVFASLGWAIVLVRWARIGLVQRLIGSLVFIGTGVGCGVLLVVVMETTQL